MTIEALRQINDNIQAGDQIPAGTIITFRDSEQGPVTSVVVVSASNMLHHATMNGSSRICTSYVGGEINNEPAFAGVLECVADPPGTPEEVEVEVPLAQIFQLLSEH